MTLPHSDVEDPGGSLRVAKSAVPSQCWLHRDGDGGLYLFSMPALLRDVRCGKLVRSAHDRLPRYRRSDKQKNEGNMGIALGSERRQCTFYLHKIRTHRAYIYVSDVPLPSAVGSTNPQPEPH